MTCQSLFSPPPVVLAPETPVAEAVCWLLDSREPALPVVDPDGRFLGMFGFHQVVTLMLPNAARLSDEIGAVNWLTEDCATIAERLGSHAKQAVRTHMDQSPGVAADASAAQALLLLHRGAQAVAVVDVRGKLAGIITPADAIRRIRGE